MMLFYPVVVILWMAVTSIATPQPSYVKLPENDKDPPNYHYMYSIDEDNGKGQGKVEMRTGELASGRYFVNGGQSSTDVKYFADEWGYHPFVKYRSTNGHSTTSTQFAIGEHAVKSLFNGTNIVNAIESTGDGGAPLGNELGPIDHDNKDNKENAYAESSTSISFVTNNINDQPSTSLQDSLVVENAGSFGQRLPEHQSDQQSVVESDEIHETPTRQSVFSPSTSNIHHSTTTSPLTTTERTIATSEMQEYIYKDDALSNFQEYLKLAGLSEVNHQEIRNFAVPQQDSTGIRLSADVNSSLESANNSNAEILEMTGKPKVPTTFSKPIVVAEVPNYERFEYSTTFPCDDDSTISVTSDTIDVSSVPNPTEGSSSSDSAVLVTPKLHGQSLITTSSLILNPIQAGVALVNADETHVIAEEDQQILDGSLKEITKIPLETVTDNERTESQDKIIESSEEIEKSEMNQMGTGYESIKATFGGRFVTSTTPVPNNDKTFEIQKSVEIYHSSPVQEIHYPGQLTSHVDDIDQGYLATQGYVSSNQHELDLATNIANGNSDHQQQSNVDPPNLLLQELEASIRSSSNLDYGKKNVEKTLENSVTQDNVEKIRLAQENATRNVNFSEFPENQHMYSLGLNELMQNAYETVQPGEINGESVRGKENVGKGTVNTEPQRFFVVERQQNEPDHSIIFNDKHTQGTSIISSTISAQHGIDEEFRNENNGRIQQYIPSSNNDRTRAYIEPIGQGSPIEIGNYVAQESFNSKINPMGKYRQKLLESQPNTISSAYQDEIQRIYSVPVDRNVEKPVPVLQPYPIPVEKIVEKKVPIPVQKLVLQPYPVHILQSYPVRKIIEKPVHIPVNGEKIVKKKVHIQQPIQVPIKFSYPFEAMKYGGNSIHIPYGISYQQIINSHNQNYHNDDNDKEAASSEASFDQQNLTNNSAQDFNRYVYDQPIYQFPNSRFSLSKRYGTLSQFGNTKYQQAESVGYQVQPINSYLSNQLVFQGNPQSVDQLTAPHRHSAHRVSEKVVQNEYLGPAPLPQLVLNLHQQNQVVHPVHQETLRYLANVARSNTPTSLRRTRLPEMHYLGRTSNFRQSKMEYGFKPPMVPSIQYDEQTATRVEN